MRALSRTLTLAGRFTVGGSLDRGGAMGRDNQPLLIAQELPLIVAAVIDFPGGGSQDCSDLTQLEPHAVIRPNLASAGRVWLRPAQRPPFVDLDVGIGETAPS